MRQVLLMLLGLVALPLARPAYADVFLAGTFDEHLSDAKIAGQVLIGLWLGEPRGNVALDPTRLVLPKRADQIRACVTASTRDGEYWMRGVYVVPSGPAEIGDMSIRSRYVSSLAAYKLSDFGITAELKEDCSNETPGPLVPAASGHDTTTLVALVNSQRAVRLQASLQLQDSVIADGHCQRYDSGRSTAFDTICRIVLPAPLVAGNYTLALVRRTRAGDNEKDSFLVSLDTAPH